MDKDELMKLITVAKLYYEEDLTQAEIAKKMGVSRPLISKMLSQARENGIVHIEILGLVEGNETLQQALKAKFGLKGCMVIPGTYKEDVNRKILLEHAGRYLIEELGKEKNIGLGWGYALSEVLAGFSKNDFISRDGNVYPMIGSANIPHKGFHTNELTTAFAACCGRLAHILYAPAFPDTWEERLVYEHTTSFQDLARLWQNTDAAVVTIRNYPTVPDEGTAGRFGSLLRQKKVVGSFLSYFFTINGEIIQGENDFAVHAPLEDLRRCPKVIALVDNTTESAALGAVKTGIITHLIVTERLAEALLVTD